jgi:hypothetical protein
MLHGRYWTIRKSRPDGSQGPTGPLGSQGPDGSQGPIGPLGSQGIDGSRGSDGIPGADGNPGLDGPTGSQGGIGPLGSQGIYFYILNKLKIKNHKLKAYGILFLKISDKKFPSVARSSTECIAQKIK